MKFDRIKKNWVINFKLKPGLYYYKFHVENEWLLKKKDEIEVDILGNENHIIIVE